MKNMDSLSGLPGPLHPLPLIASRSEGLHPSTYPTCGGYSQRPHIRARCGLKVAEEVYRKRRRSWATPHPLAEALRIRAHAAPDSRPNATTKWPNPSRRNGARRNGDGAATTLRKARGLSGEDTRAPPESPGICSGLNLNVYTQNRTNRSGGIRDLCRRGATTLLHSTQIYNQTHSTMVAKAPAGTITRPPTQIPEDPKVKLTGGFWIADLWGRSGMT